MSVTNCERWAVWCAAIEGKMAFVAWERGIDKAGEPVGRFVVDWSLKGLDHWEKANVDAIMRQFQHGRHDDAAALCEVIEALTLQGWRFTWGGEYDREA